MGTMFSVHAVFFMSVEFLGTFKFKSNATLRGSVDMEGMGGVSEKIPF
jgi:hypothetical protein